jgi:hypothetical protein
MSGVSRFLASLGMTLGKDHRYPLIVLSTAPQNKVTIVSKRHSGNLLAGIQKNSLDAGLRRYDELTVDSYLC